MPNKPRTKVIRVGDIVLQCTNNTLWRVDRPHLNVAGEVLCVCINNVDEDRSWPIGFECPFTRYPLDEGVTIVARVGEYDLDAIIAAHVLGAYDNLVSEY